MSYTWTCRCGAAMEKQYLNKEQAIVRGRKAVFIRYRWHTSPWRRVPTNAWEQIAAQMRAGRQLAPLDSVMILADVDAWLRGK